VKLFFDYLNVCDHNPPTLQTDGQRDDILMAIPRYACVVKIDHWLSIGTINKDTTYLLTYLHNKCKYNANMSRLMAITVILTTKYCVLVIELNLNRLKLNVRTKYLI